MPAFIGAHEVAEVDERTEIVAGDCIYQRLDPVGILREVTVIFGHGLNSDAFAVFADLSASFGKAVEGTLKNHIPKGLRRV